MTKPKAKTKTSAEKLAQDSATIKTYEMELDCLLSDEEVIDRAMTLASTTKKVEDQKALLAEMAKSRRKEIRDGEAQVTILSKSISTRTEMRTVKVREVIGERDVYTIRDDTGETIDSRRATQSELNLTLFPMQPTGKDAASKKKTKGKPARSEVKGLLSAGTIEAGAIVKANT